MHAFLDLSPLFSRPLLIRCKLQIANHLKKCLLHGVFLYKNLAKFM
jgi:hypothetical protein